LEGLIEPIGVTGNRSFFSEDREEFVAIRGLGRGERLRTRNGVAVVKSIASPPGQWDVFNMEIEGGHRYHVS